MGQIYFDDINLGKSYNPWKSYAQSKLANVLFTRELVHKLQGVVSYFVSPLDRALVCSFSDYFHLVVIQTDLGQHLQLTMPLWKKIWYRPFNFFIKSPTEGGTDHHLLCCGGKPAE